MPWKVTSAMEERRRFAAAKIAGEYESFAELCRAFGISRKTGYKWWARFEEGGLEALYDRSHRVRSHPFTTDPVMVEIIVAARKVHPTWGAPKLHAWLKAKGYKPPASSTIGEILRREGLIRPKKRRPRPGEFHDGLSAQDRPNAVWSADFKGWFKLKTGRKIYPLTITDGYSRFLIRCQALEHPDAMASKEVFESAFGEFGLPEVLRTDNGTPFSGIHGISALSVWWVRLGIKPERIQRGKPTQNGRHERMHRTLKADAIRSETVASSRFAQQRVFDGFRTTFNSERPHEALNMATPATIYVPSSRQYPRALQSPEYPGGWQVQRVRRDGSIRLGDKDITVSMTLRGEPVGIEYQEDGGCKIHYGPLHLASLSKSGRLTRGMRPKKVKPPEQPLVEEA